MTAISNNRNSAGLSPTRPRPAISDEGARLCCWLALSTYKSFNPATSTTQLDHTAEQAILAD